MPETLVVLPVVLIASFSFNELFKRIGLPPVVGQILAGIILGVPVIKTLIFGPETLLIVDFLSVLGIMFLLLLVGLEIDLKKIMESSKDSILISFGSAFVPLILGFIFLSAMGYDVVASLVFGGALAVTAEGTTVKVLMDANTLNTRLGVIMVTAGAIDDIFEVLFLSIVTILVHGGTFAELAVFPIELLAFAAMAFVSFKIISKVLGYIERKGDDVELFSIVLIFVLIMAILSDALQIGYLIGAIIAGFLLQVSMKSLKKKDEEEIVETTKLITLAFVVPFFFVNIGLNFDFSTLLGNSILLITTIAIAFSGKILGTLVTKPFSSLSTKQLYLVGWGMNSRGAVELVIALLARNYGLIPLEVFSALVAMAVITTLTFPFVLARGIKKNPGIMDAVSVST
ncbi:MAG: cation:proton antiporter [Candidatus Bathyarchaeia archaeon]